MNEDSEMIADSKVIHLSRPRAAKPSDRISQAFANRAKNMVAQAYRVKVAVVSEPIDRFLQFLSEPMRDVGDPDELVDVSDIYEEFTRASAAISENIERDFTQVEKYIEGLTEPDRSIINLRKEGLTYHQIGEKLDIDPLMVCRILALRFSAMTDIFGAAPAIRRK